MTESFEWLSSVSRRIETPVHCGVLLSWSFSVHIPGIPRYHLHPSWLVPGIWHTSYIIQSPLLSEFGCFQLMGIVSRRWKHGRDDGEKCEHFASAPSCSGQQGVCPSMTLRLPYLLRSPSVPPVPTGLQSLRSHCLCRIRLSSTALLRSLKLNYTSFNTSFFKMSPNSWVMFSFLPGNRNEQ